MLQMRVAPQQASSSKLDLVMALFQRIGAIIKLARDLIELGRDFCLTRPGELAKLLSFLTQITNLGFAVCHFFCHLLCRHSLGQQGAGADASVRHRNICAPRVTASAQLGAAKATRRINGKTARRGAVLLRIATSAP
jgi:hypothetical protein